MRKKPSGGSTSFEVICSTKAAAALQEEECRGLVRDVILLARERDRGIHEGLAFAFDMRGQEWQIVVDLMEGWVKILGKEELAQAMKEGVQKN